jgi:hypothetical protein
MRLPKGRKRKIMKLTSREINAFENKCINCVKNLNAGCVWGPAKWCISRAEVSDQSNAIEFCSINMNDEHRDAIN